MIKNIYWSSCKVPCYSRPILMKLEFLNRSLKNPQISNFMKICPLGTELFRVEGWMDRMT